ncbi:hypothetical protein EVAR_49707_1 [Eumeta japonica]|uniref:Uncharacterized protein n=1 Tax=Eumeta variegata TaxID=151549 RepID=A0A4C1Z6X0_EUMVA|nr:hypothetical protein EVAR_49707_1 [Eumeta japonica]
MVASFLGMTAHYATIVLEDKKTVTADWNEHAATARNSELNEWSDARSTEDSKNDKQHELDLLGRSAYRNPFYPIAAPINNASTLIRSDDNEAQSELIPPESIALTAGCGACFATNGERTRRQTDRDKRARRAVNVSSF